MLGFFKSKTPKEPLDYELRKYFEQNILWLCYEFPEPKIHERKILLPTDSDFPIEWKNTENDAIETLKIISSQMQIPFEEIELNFFTNPKKEINLGSTITFLENDPKTPEALGQYLYKNNLGKYNIALNKEILKNPEALIAVIAHELSHIKLFDHAGIEENDEMLTDLTTVYFGLGIFNANSSFNFYKTYEMWGYHSVGYLNQEEWAYSLALLAYLRNEKSPDWYKYLNRTLKNDLNIAMKYILSNEETIFNFEDE